jgi:uncharacterized protein YdhG (YjbR/CyaY superfamily)
VRNEPERVDGYIRALPPDRAAVLERLRSIIREGAPDAYEGIAYGMPAFYIDGRFLVSYAAFNDHYSLFPATDTILSRLGDRVSPHVSGRGTLRFTASQPLSDETAAEIVRTRLEELGRSAD